MKRRDRLGSVLCGCLCLLLTSPGAAQTMFTEVPIEVPLSPSLGVACGDYNNDQWPDLFLSGTGSNDESMLLGNQGNGRFADLTALIEPAPFPKNLNSKGVIFGDYDNDNDLDLYVPQGWYYANNRDRLLRNDRGKFTDVTLAAGLTDSLPSGDAIWLDFDRDGYLDLYVGHSLDNQNAPDLHDSLYRNQGDGTFADVTETVGLKFNLYPPSDTLRMGGSSGGISAGDFDGDGWPDLYLGVFEAPNRLFLNDGQGHFTDATTREIGDEGQALGVAVGDIDNDGDLDIFQAAGGLPGTFYRSLMLLNLGQGKFIDVTEGVGLAALGAQQTWGAGLADIDNDGDLDLLTATPTTLFLNQGDGTFIDATSRSGLKRMNLNLAFLDYDRDGFLDVMSGRGGSDTAGSKEVYRNNGNDNHYLRVELVGTRSNRNGIGARLIATAGELRQMREVLGGDGPTQSEVVAHFGLGTRTRVDQLEVRWPSGQVDVLNDIPADQKIRVIEGRGTYYPAVPSRVMLTDTLVVNSLAKVALSLQPALFELSAEVTSVTVDLTELGGPEAVPLQTTGDGTYKLEPISLAIEGPNGYRTLPIMIDQQTSLGPYWTRLSQQVTVVPGRDLVVFDEALAQDWQVEGNRRLQRLDLSETGVVQRGNLAGVFEGESAFTPWTVTFKPSTPVSQVGYTALRFSFRLGEVVPPAIARFTATLVPGKAVSLLDSARVDLNRKEWQVVEIPMAAFESTGPVTAITISGNFAGTFYLDDIRLVATTPAPVTVVEEERTTALPQAFSLSQNFPNPFNSSTVIRFALPENGEVELAIYNLAGQRVVTLAEGAREAGSYTILWDGRDGRGKELASGVYLYRLWAGAQVETRKLVLVR